MKIKTYVSREWLEQLVLNTLKKGATMEQVHQMLDNLNVVLVD